MASVSRLLLIDFSKSARKVKKEFISTHPHVVQSWRSFDNHSPSLQKIKCKNRQPGKDTSIKDMQMAEQAPSCLRFKYKQFNILFSTVVLTQRNQKFNFQLRLDLLQGLMFSATYTQRNRIHLFKNQK